MNHHGRVDVVEHPGLEHPDLSAAAFLGRTAVHEHRDAQIVGEFGQRLAGAHGGTGDDVMPTGMADPGERVVLGTDAQMKRPGARFGDERRLQSGHAKFHGN